MSGAVFKKLMADIRKGGMYPYSSKLIPASRNQQNAKAYGRQWVRKIARSRGEMADTIERFVHGICNRWDWDDFCTVPIIDFQLDAIRLRCADLPQEFPSTQKGHYCSEAGIEVLREMVRELRKPQI